MTTTFDLISSVTLGSGGATSIGFTNIPATHKDLLLILCAKSNLNGDVDGCRITINGTDIYPSGTTIRVIGNGGGIGADASFNSIVVPGSGSLLTNIFGNAEIYFGDYTGSNAKVVSIMATTEKNAATYAFQSLGAQKSTVTSAITSLSVGNMDSGGTLLVENSTAYLYGIKNS